MRLIDADALILKLENDIDCMDDGILIMFTQAEIKDIKNAPTVEVVRCKDCIHKPKPTEDYNPSERDGTEIKFPDYICPMQCEDVYYNRIPRDDWFCGNAERKKDD